jgi:hypothetical protein
MGGDGAPGDEHAGGDLRVGQALGHRLGHGELGRSEALPAQRGPRPGAAAAGDVADRLGECQALTLGPGRAEAVSAERLPADLQDRADELTDGRRLPHPRAVREGRQGRGQPGGHLVLAFVGLDGSQDGPALQDGARAEWIARRRDDRLPSQLGDQRVLVAGAGDYRPDGQGRASQVRSGSADAMNSSSRRRAVRRTRSVAATFLSTMT